MGPVIGVDSEEERSGICLDDDLGEGTSLPFNPLEVEGNEIRALQFESRCSLTLGGFKSVGALVEFVHTIGGKIDSCGDEGGLLGSLADSAQLPGGGKDVIVEPDSCWETKCSIVYQICALCCGSLII